MKYNHYSNTIQQYNQTRLLTVTFLPAIRRTKPRVGDPGVLDVRSRLLGLRAEVFWLQVLRAYK